MDETKCYGIFNSGDDIYRQCDCFIANKPYVYIATSGMNLSDIKYYLAVGYFGCYISINISTHKCITQSHLVTWSDVLNGRNKKP